MAHFDSNTPPPATVIPPPKPPRAAGQILPKVWVTQYALTRGVYTAENVVVSLTSDQMITIHYKSPSGYNTQSWIHKPYWHTTEDEARAHVQKMAAAKVKSLMLKKAKLVALMVNATGELPTRPWGG